MQDTYIIKSLTLKDSLDLVFLRMPAGSMEPETVTVKGLGLSMPLSLKKLIAEVTELIVAELDVKRQFEKHKLDEKDAPMWRHVAAEKIEYGQDKQGEFCALTLRLGMYNMSEPLAVKLPKAYLRPGDERQLDMFPADLESALLALRSELSLFARDWSLSLNSSERRSDEAPPRGVEREAAATMRLVRKGEELTAEA